MDCSKCVDENRKWLYARVLRIAILLIWLFSVCTMCFATESEIVTFDVVSGLALDNNNIGTRQFIEGSLNIGYVIIEPRF